jgi:hypothetical protein
MRADGMIARRAAWVLAFTAALQLAGCAAPAPPPLTLTRTQFLTQYNNYQAFTDVWYMGSDSQFNYFRMEHWKLNPDGTNASLDSYKIYRVSLTELGVKDPFPLTQNENQWRLLRPRHLPQ